MKFCTLCRRAAPGGATICSYDGSPLSAETPVEPGPGARVAGYQLLEVVARGDTGTVYRAEDSAANRVSLKLLHPELCANAAVMHRIRRETKNAIKLASANVARVVDCGDHSGRFYLAREWVEGHPLSVALREEGRMEVGRAATVAYQVCAGLALVHRVGLVHRDLKPNHVLLHEVEPGAWATKLLDIGVAAPIEGCDGPREVFGTAEYLSPEQAEGKLVSFRSDLYSLGCLLFEMLAGAPPFSGEPRAQLEQHRATEPAPLDALRPEVPAPLAQLAAKLMSKQASARPFSAAMVQRELERIVPRCKDPLAPVTTGRARPVLSSSAPARPVVPASAAPPGPAASPAPRPGGGQPDDFGMAQTLFGGTADVQAMASAVRASDPGAQPAPQPPAPAVLAPEAHGQAPAPQQPGASGAPWPPQGQPAFVPAQPDGSPSGAPDPGVHKKTMLGFPVVNPQARAAPSPQLAPQPSPGQAPDGSGSAWGAGATQQQPGGYSPAGGYQPVQQQPSAPGQGYQQGAFQPGTQPQAYAAPAQPPMTEDVRPPGSGVLKWVLLGIGVFLLVPLLLAVAGGVVYCATRSSPEPDGAPGPVAIVELVDREAEALAEAGPRSLR